MRKEEKYCKDCEKHFDVVFEMQDIKDENGSTIDYWEMPVTKTCPYCGTDWLESIADECVAAAEQEIEDGQARWAETGTSRKESL